MRKTIAVIVVVVLVVGAVAVVWVNHDRNGSPAPQVTEQVAFADFQDGLSTAKATSYVHQTGFAVKSTAAFEDMRQYLLDYYDGVTPTRTITNDTQIIDCVPIDQQPSLRTHGGTSVAASPPPFSPPGEPDRTAANAPQAAKVVSGGGCDTGTIPLMRITLSDMAHFETLSAFFSKG